MKKTISILLALVMVFAFAACATTGTTSTPPPTTSTTPPPTTSATPPPPSPTVTAPPPVEPSTPATAWDPAKIGNHTFILAHGMAETSQVGVQYHQFAEAVKELSGGKIIVEERIAGSLVTDTETLDAIMNGTIDFAHSMGSYVSGTITDLSPLTIAGYYGGNNWLGFANDTYDLISSIYADYGVKYVGALYQGNSYIACTDKQIKNPGDVKGLTFRASGTWVSKTVQAWGGSAVTIGLADLADSFSKKTVQGVATGMNIIVPFKIYEVAKYLTLTSISEGFAALIMNGDTWNSLNSDEQALITEAGKIFVQKAYDIAVTNVAAYEKTVNDAGLNEIYKLTDAEQAEFIKIAYSLYPEMEKEVGAKGQELINLLKQINGIA